MKPGLILEVQRVAGGWRAWGCVTLENGNQYEAATVVRQTLRNDLQNVSGYRVGEDDDEPEREESVKELLDQLIALLENPILQPVLPLSVRVTVKAIKGIRRQIERSKQGDTAAGFNLAKLQYDLENPVICSALRAQRLFGDP